MSGLYRVDWRNEGRDNAVTNGSRVKAGTQHTRRIVKGKLKEGKIYEKIRMRKLKYMQIRQ